MDKPVTTLCYLEKDDSYLMLHRVKKKNDLNEHKWIGIGGKFEKGESPEDCLIREAMEERKAGVQVLVAQMNKNKRFQKEQLAKDGYAEFKEFYKEGLKR